jgi:hypothetical protein
MNRGLVPLCVTFMVLSRCVFGQASPDQLQAWSGSATLIFAGTVVATNSSNVANVAGGENTRVVRIDQIRSAHSRKESSLGAWVGKQVTVVSEPGSSGSALKPGDHGIFFTNPRVYSDNIAVDAVAAIPLPAEQESARHLFSQLNAAAESKVDNRLLQEIKSAEAVVTGKVVEVRPLPEPKLRAFAAGEDQRHISEHDPKWKEAVINVESVDKGDTSQKQVVVVFPSTDDRAWVDAPYYKVGDAGTWILHKNQVEDAQAQVLLTPEKIGEKPVQTYTTLSKADFQPIEATGANQARIRRLIDATQ